MIPVRRRQRRSAGGGFSPARGLRGAGSDRGIGNIHTGIPMVPCGSGTDRDRSAGLRPFPNGQQPAETAQQQCADGDGAAVDLLGKQLQRRRSDRRADAVAHASDGETGDLKNMVLGAII